MGNNQRPLDEQLRRMREEAVMELAELRKMDECALTPRLLVRKAMLLQFDDAPGGTPEEIEAALSAALQQDEHYIEAYIELGRYYYSVLDDNKKAKSILLKGLELLHGFARQIIQGLVDCDAETQTDPERHRIQRVYESILLGSDHPGSTQPSSETDPE